MAVKMEVVTTDLFKQKVINCKNSKLKSEFIS